MNRTRRAIAVALACTLTAATAVAADPWPARPLTFIVPYAPGGLTDQLAREVGAHVSASLKQPVVVENRPGGGAQIAMTALKQAPADGHTVFVGDVPSLATNVGLFSKLSYDPRTDLQMVTQLVVSPGLFVVPVSSPFRTFDDMIAAARSRNGGLSYATQGVGSGGHLFGTLLAKKLGAPMISVAYRGSVPGLTETMGGQIDFMYDAIPTAGQFVKGGKLRALAVGADQRSALFPDVPTLKELGHGDIVPTFWWGIAVRAGTPAPIVERIASAVAAAMADPAVARKFTEQGVIVQTSDPKRFSAYVEAETALWTKVMRDAGMSAD